MKPQPRNNYSERYNNPKTTMSATTTDPISDLIDYLRSLEAEKLRRLAVQSPAPKQIPAGFFGFIAETPAIPEPEPFGTPLFTLLPATL